MQTNILVTGWLLPTNDKLCILQWIIKVFHGAHEENVPPSHSDKILSNTFWETKPVPSAWVTFSTSLRETRVLSSLMVWSRSKPFSAAIVRAQIGPFGLAMVSKISSSTAAHVAWFYKNTKQNGTRVRHHLINKSCNHIDLTVLSWRGGQSWKLHHPRQQTRTLPTTRQQPGRLSASMPRRTTWSMHECHRGVTWSRHEIHLIDRWQGRKGGGGGPAGFPLLL